MFCLCWKAQILGLYMLERGGRNVRSTLGANPDRTKSSSTPAAVRYDQDDILESNQEETSDLRAVSGVVIESDCAIHGSMEEAGTSGDDSHIVETREESHERGVRSCKSVALPPESAFFNAVKPCTLSQGHAIDTRGPERTKPESRKRMDTKEVPLWYQDKLARSHGTQSASPVPQQKKPYNVEKVIMGSRGPRTVVVTETGSVVRPVSKDGIKDESWKVNKSRYRTKDGENNISLSLCHTFNAMCSS